MSLIWSIFCRYTDPLWFLKKSEKVRRPMLSDSSCPRVSVHFGFKMSALSLTWGGLSFIWWDHLSIIHRNKKKQIFRWDSRINRSIPKLLCGVFQGYFNAIVAINSDISFVKTKTFKSFDLKSIHDITKLFDELVAKHKSSRTEQIYEVSTENWSNRNILKHYISKRP